MVDCKDYKKGRSLGYCDGMGHFQCDECRWRKPKKYRDINGPVTNETRRSFRMEKRAEKTQMEIKFGTT